METGKEVLEVQCQERWIPPIKECSWFEDGEVVMILDITERYKDYMVLWSAKQANKLPLHTEYDYTITFKDPKAKPPTHPIYKTTWKEKDAL